MANDKLVDGIMAKKPHEKAPDFIKAKVSVKADAFIPFIEANTNERGWLNLELKESREGKLYFSLDSFEPKKQDDGF